MGRKMLLKDRIALVTGAAQGIGEFIAREFCAAGATVILADIDVERLESTTAAIRAEGYDASSAPLDVCDRSRVKTVIPALLARHGRIDILVNNAGAYPRRDFREMSDEEWDRIVDLNLTGVYNCTRAVVPGMVERQDGVIINISSVTYLVGLANLTHYVSAKGGVVGFTRALARDLGRDGIRVNCISPGAVATASEAQVYRPGEVEARILPLQSLQRRILPRDIANVAVFLASEMSSGMTGQTVNVDGGWAMY